MSFTTAFDNFHTEVLATTGFSSKIQIPNPYDITKNSTHMLRNSYGIRVGSSSFISLDFNTTNDDTLFSIVISKEVEHLDNNPDTINDAIKSIKEDLTELRKHLLECDVVDIALVEYTSTDPIEFYDGCVYTTINFNVRISDIIAPC